MAAPRKIVISSNQGAVVKADNDACFSNPVETTDPATGETVLSSFAVCGTCIDCNPTTLTGNGILDYMYVHAQNKGTRVKAPTMRVTVTDPSALVAGAVDWCGERWTFPADNGKCVEVRPNNYQLRQIQKYEEFNYRAVNYNYHGGKVVQWGGNDFSFGAGRYNNALYLLSAMHRWGRITGSQIAFNIGIGYQKKKNFLDRDDSTMNIVGVNAVREVIIRADRVSGPISIGVNTLIKNRRVINYKKCTYTKIGNRYYVQNPPAGCTGTSTLTLEDGWPTVLPYPTLSSNYRLSTSTRTTTSPVHTTRKGSVTDGAGLVYSWELGNYWGTT